MKKITVKIPAKINLTLDVVGKTEKFHLLNSLVASIDLYDTITVKERKDGVITLTERGLSAGCLPSENNAFKAAVAFKKEFGKGVDIILNKSIPIGNGLGGSSADIAGTLLGLQKLYDTQNGIEEIATSLGSDTAHMLKGGYAVISGRGEKVDFKKIDQTLYLVIIPENAMVTAKESYAKFDQLNLDLKPITQKATTLLEEGEIKEFCSVIKNDLYLSSKLLQPIIKRNLNLLKLTDCETCLMTGSGSATFGIYRDKKTRDKAFKALKKIVPNAIKTKTL